MEEKVGVSEAKVYLEFEYLTTPDLAKVLEDVRVPLMKKVKGRRDKLRLKRIKPGSWEIVIKVGPAVAPIVINEIRNKLRSTSKRRNFTRIEKEVFDQEGNRL